MTSCLISSTNELCVDGANDPREELNLRAENGAPLLVSKLCVGFSVMVGESLAAGVDSGAAAAGFEALK
jgi:hypothetical protein